MDSFGKKFKELSGTAIKGVKNVLKTIRKNVMETQLGVTVGNHDEEICQMEEEREIELENEKAKEMMEQIQLEEDIQRAKEAEKMRGNLSKNRYKKGKLMLRRIDPGAVEDYGKGEEADE